MNNRNMFIVMIIKKPFIHWKGIRREKIIYFQLSNCELCNASSYLYPSPIRWTLAMTVPQWITQCQSRLVQSFKSQWRSLSSDKLLQGPFNFIRHRNRVSVKKMCLYADIVGLRNDWGDDWYVQVRLLINYFLCNVLCVCLISSPPKEHILLYRINNGFCWVVQRLKCI